MNDTSKANVLKNMPPDCCGPKVEDNGSDDCCGPKAENTTGSEDCCSTSSNAKKSLSISAYLPTIFSFILLITGILLDNSEASFFYGIFRLLFYIIAYIPVAYSVLKQAFQNILKGDVFTEFFLMGIATIGAFALGHYHEGVAVMLFYTLGEHFQHSAVAKSKRNIQALLDIRPKDARVLKNGSFVSEQPQDVSVGETIQVLKGEKVPLDAVLVSPQAVLDTSAITGESKPQTATTGENVFAGSINLDAVIELQTTKSFENSSVSRILHLVQEATARKSKTELFIRKFARVYTPIVVVAAILLTLLPYFFVEDYQFGDWLYRALVFLVISCPCALVISIPLGYFGGLGAASQHGILFKGASFLDTITKINTVVLDKTGTLTKGVFKIREIHPYNIREEMMMAFLQALESQSTHPIARAIQEYKGEMETIKATEVMEISGKGLMGKIGDQQAFAGNKALMEHFHITVPSDVDTIVETVVILAVDGQYKGYVTLADELKEDAIHTISQLRDLGIENIIMLSGDKDNITAKLGNELKLQKAMGGLLPEDKLKQVNILKENPKNRVAFVGDGINDAPVLAASDVGIAMGALGSDVAIETADIVIQTDHPSKIALAMKIGRATRNIVWQNIALAFGVKLIVLILGAGGIATMWEAVFADVGVAFLAILNAVRLQRVKDF